MTGPRKLKPRRRAQVRAVLKMRARGLSYAAIARELGVTRQAVDTLLKSMKTRGISVPSLVCRCEDCGTAVAERLHGRIQGGLLCLPCLTAKSETTFGQRLRALRIAAGYNLKALARKTGIGPTHIGGMERGVHVPHWPTLVTLMNVFGVRLVDLRNELGPIRREASK